MTNAEPPAPPPSHWIERHLPLVNTSRTMLDLAAGRGRHVALGLDRGYRVTALDRDVTGLSRFAANPDATVVAADLETADAPWVLGARTFDVVVVTNYLWRPLFPDLLATVAPGGLLLYETFALGQEALGRPRNPDFLLHRNELLDRVRPTLDVVAFEDLVDPEPQPAVRQRIVARRRAPVDAPI
ncbi:MAG: hypothetical protein P1U65_18420 [Minwuia sp.]|nr:hypothetical protein [Minwuia sp.]